MLVDPVIIYLEDQGLLRIGALTATWVVVGAKAASVAGLAFGPYQYPAMAAAYLVACATGGGCLVAFWAAAGALNNRLRGYSLRPRRGPEWHYKERDSRGHWQVLALSQRITAPGHPARREVVLPSEDAWDATVPSWAQGRRSEIAARIAEFFGDRVEFLDAPSRVNSREHR